MTPALRFVLSLVFLVSCAAAVSAQTRAPELGHFKCYQVTNPTPLDIVVGTQDQFDIADKSGFEPTAVRQAWRFCNPVAKLHRRAFYDIPDRSAHLTMYLTAPTDIGVTRRVLIANQFGKQRLLTFSAPVLATPTAKNNEGFPEGLDHYKCYRAYGRPVKATVSLRDQFHDEPQVRVGYPLLFCNPTRKEHDGVFTGVKNAQDHLACYQLEPRPFETSVAAIDQFGTAERRVKDANLLCAPTAKLRFERIE